MLLSRDIAASLAGMVIVGAALAIVAAQHSESWELIGGLTTDGTGCYRQVEGIRDARYRLRLRSRLPRSGYLYAVCSSGQHGAIFGGVRHVVQGTDGTFATRFLTCDGDTVCSRGDLWFVAPLPPAKDAAAKALVWQPEEQYRPASPTHGTDAKYLFLHNYRNESRLRNKGRYFERAARSAAKGESLAVRSNLLALSCNGAGRSVAAVPRGYGAHYGQTFRRGDSAACLVNTKGGYQDADMVYVLLEQPILDCRRQSLQMFHADDPHGTVRGVFAVDAETGSILWEAHLGATPVREMSGDLDGDGYDELVIQTYSGENGINGSGMTDAGMAYIVCLDWSGHVLWKRRFLGVHVGVMSALTDLDHDGKCEVVAAWSSAKYGRLGGVAVLSGNGQTVAERTDLGGLYGLAVADIDADGEQEIVVGAPEAQVFALDRRLKVESEYTDTTRLWKVIPDPPAYSDEEVFTSAQPDSAQRRRVIPYAAADLDGDGRDEVVANSIAYGWWVWTSYRNKMFWAPECHILTLGTDLEEEARCALRADSFGLTRPPPDAPASLHSSVMVLDADADNHPEIALNCRGLYVIDVVPQSD